MTSAATLPRRGRPPSSLGSSGARFPAASLLLLVVLLLVLAVPPSLAADVETCAAADRADGACADADGSDPSPDGGDGGSSECRDVDPKCETYASDGACDENPGYMTHKCPAACGTCGAVRDAAKAAEVVRSGAFGEPCADDDFRCLDWATMGECDNNPGYMRRSCRHSCMTCFEGTKQFGVGQRIPSNGEALKAKQVEDANEATKQRIQRSLEYMKTVWSDDEYRDVRHKCKNQHQDCTFWAALGECEANEKYMKTNCAPACESCDLLDIKHRCPVLPGNDSIWKPGDLNTLMEDIVDDASGSGEWKKYNPRPFSRPKLRRDGSKAPGAVPDGPWVILLENFMREEEADRLVELGKLQGYERSADVGKEKPDGTHDSTVSESRTSHNTWCKDPSCVQDPLVVPVVERIANVTRTGIKNSEYLQLLQYEPGQYYRQHHDYIPHHRGMPCGVRILTLFIYLNDVEEGGGTNFPLLDLTVQPKKGSALLWPSVLDESPESKDGRTDHQALPVVKGIKYGANAWIHSRDFKAAYEINCH
ncbi:hypothetical protein ACHAWF_015200 [Thalassiosira exigua]